MSRISNFSSVADRYDATRHIPEPILLGCFRLLAASGALPHRGRVLDIGCGTGQISCPMAKSGHEVIGLDASEAMVRIAAAKVLPSWQASFAVGDARSIAAPTGAFDATVFSKLLMHVEDWRSACGEIVRVTRPGGAVIQISDRGSFGNAVRRAFARRADELGYRDRFLGPEASSGAVSAHIAGLGCAVSTIEPGELRWERRVTAREALDAFRERVFAEFWTLPVAVYDTILSEVAAWAAARPGGLDAEELLRPFLSVEIYRTPR